MKHSHCCGLDGGEFDPSAGCGFEWSHEDTVLFLPKDEYEREHHCPRCGRGPWTFKSKMEDSPTMGLLKGLIITMLVERMDDENNGSDAR